MRIEDLWAGALRSARRERILLSFTQPLTATHVSRRADVTLKTCSSPLRELARLEVLTCLNAAGASRLYRLTPLGISWRKKITSIRGVANLEHAVPDVDWELYAWTCFRHRAAVIRALSESLLSLPPQSPAGGGVQSGNDPP